MQQLRRRSGQGLWCIGTVVPDRPVCCAVVQWAHRGNMNPPFIRILHQTGWRWLMSVYVSRPGLGCTPPKHTESNPCYILPVIIAPALTPALQYNFVLFL